MITLLEAIQILFGKTENLTKEEQDILRKWINGEIKIDFLDKNEEDDD